MPLKPTYTVAESMYVESVNPSSVNLISRDSLTDAASPGVRYDSTTGVSVTGSVMISVQALIRISAAIVVITVFIYLNLNDSVILGVIPKSVTSVSINSSLSTSNSLYHTFLRLYTLNTENAMLPKPVFPNL